MAFLFRWLAPSLPGRPRASSVRTGRRRESYMAANKKKVLVLCTGNR
jgi:hypothetical protein